MENERLKVSLSNGVFSDRTLDENLATVKRLGFENLEFNMKSVRSEDDSAAYTAKKIIAAHGLKCLTLHAATLHVKDEIEVHRAIYYGKVSADFAHILSAPIMVVHSNVSRKLPESLRSKCLTRIFEQLSPYAKSLNLRLALENLSYASSGFGKDVAELEEMLRTIDSDGTMGVTLDFCHAEATGQTFNLLEQYEKRLCNVHLSGRAHKSLNAETPNVSKFIASLNRLGYMGPLTIEVNSKCSTDEILKTKTILENAVGGIE
jgi:sugar phosphate isomerase/epimerase